MMCLYSSIQFNSSKKNKLRDSLFHTGEEQKAMDPSLNSEVHFYTDSVTWKQKVAASLADSFLLKGKVSYMYQKGADYLPGESEFKTFILPGKQNRCADQVLNLKPLQLPWFCGNAISYVDIFYRICGRSCWH